MNLRAGASAVLVSITHEGTAMKKKASKAKAKTRKSAKKQPVRKSAVRARAGSAAKRAPRPKHAFTRDLYGWITHTDLASNAPAATKAWCAEVLGWKFTMDIPIPGGAVHLFAYSNKGGGAVRPVSPPEIPGSIPYVHVADCAAAYAKALAAGAEEMMSPTRVMAGVTVAIVRAPGGVPIGFSGP